MSVLYKPCGVFLRRKRCNYATTLRVCQNGERDDFRANIAPCGEQMLSRVCVCFSDARVAALLDLSAAVCVCVCVRACVERRFVRVVLSCV